MAAQQLCDGPDQGPAVFIVHNLETVDFTAFCLACFADFAQAYLQAVDPGRLAPPPPPAVTKPRKRAAPAAAVADDKSEGEDNGSVVNARPAAGQRRPPGRTAN